MSLTQHSGTVGNIASTRKEAGREWGLTSRMRQKGTIPVGYPSRRLGEIRGRISGRGIMPHDLELEATGGMARNSNKVGMEVISGRVNMLESVSFVGKARHMKRYCLK